MKGFLSKDIHRMGQAHNDSGIELAKALCEQTNWPLKPVSIYSGSYFKASSHFEIVAFLDFILMIIQKFTMQ